jgi:diguanylate cyclase (GGDEF)-like protein
MGGSNQSLFLLGALLLAQGSAALPLLAVGLLLSLVAMPGWLELLLMWPNRVGGIAAACGEAFRPYSPVLANLAGTCYWWGWVPTCGLTALIAAGALHAWVLPWVPVSALAILIVVVFAVLTLGGIRRVTSVAVAFAGGAAALAFASVVLPVVRGTVDWHQATTYSLSLPFPGIFGSVTSAMAGLYLIGFAAPAFEAAGCHVGETVDPVRNLPRAFYASAAMAVLFFVVLPPVWLGVIGPSGLEGDLVRTLGPTFAPLAGGAARAAVVGFVVLNMFCGSLQPLAGAARTLSQLSDDGLLPRLLGRRNRRDAPWVATVLTASMAIVFLLLGDPTWLIAAANFTYLIGIALPSVAVWLLRRHSPHLHRPYRAARGTVMLGVAAAGAWAVSAVLGFEQFGLPTVVFGVALAYSGATLYAVRCWQDRRAAGLPRRAGSLQSKLTGAMLLVLTLDGIGYLIAVRFVARDEAAVNTILSDIFVAVAVVTVSVGLVLPGLIAFAATQVASAARRLAEGSLADLTWAMENLADGDLDSVRPAVAVQPVVVHSSGELAEMAASFNVMQDEVERASTALEGARLQLQGSRGRLRYLAETDPLTGASNRRHFAEKLDEALAAARATGKPGAVLILDLDNFKYVNDSQGHAAGDGVLQRAAEVLRLRLRGGDVIARLGGDEFAVLLSDTTPSEAETVGRDLLAAFREAHLGLTNGSTVRLTTSIGIATFDETHTVAPDELLVNADIAMYDAKAAGRDCVCVAAVDDHQEQVKSRQSWVDRIRTALDHDQMELHAQPILHLASNTITQHELLIRMRSEAGDLIPPAAFLETAERSGTIRQIDRWVVQSACRMISQARTAGASLRLEVNVSGVSVSDPEFLASIEPFLEGIRDYADDLVFELTETAAIVNLAQATAFAEGLASSGFRLALDDFGAGFGSFYYLKHLPCAYLKIDGDFIKNLPTSPVDQVFVRSIVELAKGLNKWTIAEFVEDEATLELLRELGVDYAQGYHVGRPAPLAASGVHGLEARASESS